METTGSQGHARRDRVFNYATGKRPKEGVQWLLRAGMLCQPAVICTYVIPERDMQHKFDQSIRTSTSCKLRAYFPLVCKAAC